MKYVIEVEDGQPNPSMPWRAEARPSSQAARLDPVATGWGSTPAAAAQAAVEDWLESELAERGADWQGDAPDWMIRNVKGDWVQTNLRPGDDTIEVAMTREQAHHFEEWLDKRGWVFARLPIEEQDDLPLYILTPRNDLMERLRRG